jgi:hypothetical protein
LWPPGQVPANPRSRRMRLFSWPSVRSKK